MSRKGAERCLMLVHAHPDDESIFTGVTMARYAAEGARVVLVTCTMGELGAIRITHPAGQGSDQPSGASRMAMLGQLRARELEAACAELGVTEHWYLGGPGRWHDSGMGDHGDPHSFCNADLDQATDELAVLVRKVQPQVMVTYDANGFYGHPDHIQAHLVAWRAYQRACQPLRTKFYTLTMPRPLLADAINEAQHSEPGGGETVTPDDFPEIGLPDDRGTTQICAESFLDAKLAALKAHATQIEVDGPFFEAVGLPKMRALGTEYYLQVSGPGAVTDGSGGPEQEDDLFRGL